MIDNFLVSAGLGRALTTQAGDNHMPEIGFKAVFLHQRSPDRTEQVFQALLRLAAPGADNVMMMPLFCMMIDWPITGFTLHHAVQVLEQVQSAVNGGLVHTGHARFNHGYNLSRGQMSAGLMKEPGDQLPLGCQLETVLS